MFAEKLSEHAKYALGILSGILDQSSYLAGGTALALHLNHRQSFDLDIYIQHEFNVDELIQQLEQSIRSFSLISTSRQTIVGKSLDTEISIFYYKYKLLEEFAKFGTFNIAAVSDIAAMKLEAIAGRGLKRDFFDLYCICKERSWSLIKIIELHEKKYLRNASNLPHILKSLVYFEDAEAKPERAQTIDVKWEEIKKFFIEETEKTLKTLT